MINYDKQLHSENELNCTFSCLQHNLMISCNFSTYLFARYAGVTYSKPLCNTLRLQTGPAEQDARVSASGALLPLPGRHLISYKNDANSKRQTLDFCYSLRSCAFFKIYVLKSHMQLLDIPRVDHIT